MAADASGLKNYNMKNHWRKVLAIMPDAIERKAFQHYFKKEHQKLQAHNAAGIVSNFSKQQALRSLHQQYKVNTLVETGTYLGDTLFALYPYFSKLYSIELSEFYFAKAKQRFARYNKIKLIQGDSGKELKKLMSNLSEAALFWLDGHYSGGRTAKGEKECPLFEELDAIFSSALKHIIVIDDARLFVGKNDYPTVDEVRGFLARTNADYTLTIENDSIRLLPKL
jgi:hypothetical protein